MVHKIVGIRAAQGVSKKTNKPFDSYILAVTYATSEMDEGIGAGELFVDKSLLAEEVKNLGSYKLLVGEEIDIDRNAGGFIIGVRIV